MKIPIRMLLDYSKIEAARPKSKISNVFGLLKRNGQSAISIEEMNETIADGWADKA